MAKGSKTAVHVLRYPPGTLVGDYLRAGAGIGVGLCVLAINPVSWPLGLIFGGLTGMFGAFGLRTAQRHLTKVGVDRSGLARAAFGTREIPWDELHQVKLRYFGTKRQQRSEGGFYQLKLAGAGTRMTFESNLDGFDYLVWRAAKAARENRRSVDPTTAGNLLDLGIDADGEQTPPAAVAERARQVDGADADRRDAFGRDGPARRRSA